MKTSIYKPRTRLECPEHSLSPGSMPKYLSSMVSLSDDRIMFINEPFTRDLASEFCALLLHYDNQCPHEEIIIHINSPGGEAGALMQMVDTMRMISSPTTVINIGSALSAGAFLLAAGDYRLGFKNALYMLHGAQLTYPMLCKDIKENADYLAFVEKMNNKVLNIIVEATGRPLELVREDCARDLYMNSQEALDYGLIDDIIGAP